MNWAPITECMYSMLWAGSIAGAMLAAGCHRIIGIEDLPAWDASVGVTDAPWGGHVIRGIASGVLGPVALELRSGKGTEIRAVTQDGPFSFETRLEDGDTYTVLFVDPAVPCNMQDQTGVLAGADAIFELRCDAPSLESAIVSGMASTIDLVPGNSEYVVDVPLSQLAATVTVTAAKLDDEVTIAGTPVSSGMPGPSMPLNLGSNQVDIVVENHLGWQRSYRLTIRRAAQIAQYAYAKASRTESGDLLGYSVALSGDTLAVGAHGEDSAAVGLDGDATDNGAANSGAVYIFRHNGSAWQHEAYVKASNTGAGDNFGWSVALSGDVLAVGAPLEDSAATATGGSAEDDTATNSGAVYVFRRLGSSWRHEAYIKASNTGAGDAFGWSVALDGDTLAVGAPGEDSAARGVNGAQADNSATDGGAVYVLRHADSAWQPEAYIKASNTEASDNFGYSVAMAASVLAVGARHEDSGASGVDGDELDNSASNSGAAYVFRRAGSVWQHEAYLKAVNTDAGDLFGVSMALSESTLVVGAPAEDSAAVGIGGDPADDGSEDSGAVYVFRYTGSVWQHEEYVKSSNTGDGDRFGYSVTISGDSIAIGAPEEDSSAAGMNGEQADESAPSSGAVYLLRRTGSLWQHEAYLKSSNSESGDRFGYGMALAGSVLAVGSYLEDGSAAGLDGNQGDNGATDSGAIYVFH